MQAGSEDFGSVQKAVEVFHLERQVNRAGLEVIPFVQPFAGANAEDSSYVSPIFSQAISRRLNGRRTSSSAPKSSV
jgi:hypothetical protein